MKAEKPKIAAGEMFKLLRLGSAVEFNARRAKGEACDLRGSDLRGADLRGLDADGLDLSNCYLRQTDLRGVDLSKAKMEGASIHGAQIGGTYFPRELAADEIVLSVTHGTRMRYSCVKVGQG